MRKIAISQWIAEQMFACGIDSRGVAIIPDGVDRSRFRMLQDIEKRPQRIAFMYAGANYKAPEDAVQALIQVKERFPLSGDMLLAA